jgi:hypothetical protein
MPVAQTERARGAHAPRAVLFYPWRIGEDGLPGETDSA